MFDPNLPQENTPADAAQMRSQFNGLKDLIDAVNDTSRVSNSVATLDDAFVNDPPTLADLEVMRAKMNELITALRR